MEPPTIPQRAAPVRRLPPPPRAPVSEGLTYRWERLHEDQRERAWGLLEQMHSTLALQRRRRRRVLLAAVLLALMVVALAYLALHSVTL